MGHRFEDDMLIFKKSFFQMIYHAAYQQQQALNAAVAGFNPHAQQPHGAPVHNQAAAAAAIYMQPPVRIK
jgi:hypothetical protein